MNPFMLIALLSAAQASQQPRNNAVRTPAVRRSGVYDSCANHDSAKRRRKRCSIIVRVAAVIALMISLIVGLIVFTFTF